jgi:DNA-binding NarL/FixJ family response regulator
VMAVVDDDRATAELTEARRAMADLEWDVAAARFAEADDAGVLAAEDLVRWAEAAYLVGHRDDCLTAFVRAHRELATRGQVHDAVRCGFWVAFVLVGRGDVGQASGWLTRCERLLASTDEEGPGAGYLLVHEAFRAAAIAHDHVAGARAAEAAGVIGRSSGDTDLLTLALTVEGRAGIGAGDVTRGLARLDEAMVSVATAEVSPVVAGTVYCSAIEACEEVLDLGRAKEWTAALTTWCDRQHGMLTFTGQCLTHRAALLCVEGRLEDAEHEARRACDRFAGAADEESRGRAHYELAQVHRLRGDHRAAESGYLRSADAGHDPQPGLALLRLAQGRVDVAASMARRVLDETPLGPARLRVLGPCAEVLLGAGDIAAAGVVADELAGLAAEVGTRAAAAEADHCAGSVALARGDGRSALPRLRRAAEGWRSVHSPPQAARCRLLIASACALVGDRDTAAAEADAARRELSRLGVVPPHLPTQPSGPEPGPALSPRELEVLALVAEGRTNRLIADELVVAVRTVDRHVENILGKLGVHSRAAATAVAYERGLLPGRPASPPGRTTHAPDPGVNG